jgi:hypothetical protein
MRFTISFLLLAIAGMVIITIGCSSAVENPVEPFNTEPDGRTGLNGDRVIWGVYRFAFDPDSNQVELIPCRNGAFHADVTSFVIPPNCMDCVQIIGSQYKPALEEWNLTIGLKNPSPISGYDVRGLVFSLGDKYLKNSDGCMSQYLGQDILFKAFAKDEPNRVFSPGAMHDVTYVFHFPAGSNWNSVDYIVDASWPGNCKEPIVEDIDFPGSMQAGGDPATLRVRAFDHQGDNLEVFADLSPIGGSANEPLFDDGAHGDGASGDSVFGATGIVADCAGGDYKIIINASDTVPKEGCNSCRVEVTSVNHDPVINEITASRTTCEKGNVEEKVTLACIADDEDDDELEYHWSCIAGEFSDEYGQTTDWFPPDEIGKFTVSCEVTDGNGGIANDDSGLIRVTQYFVINPSPTPEYTCERILDDTSFNKSDYNPPDVVVMHFWGA